MSTCLDCGKELEVRTGRGHCSPRCMPCRAAHYQLKNRLQQQKYRQKLREYILSVRKSAQEASGHG